MLIHKVHLPYKHKEELVVEGRLLSVDYQGIYSVGWYQPQEKYHNRVICVWTGQEVKEELDTSKAGIFNGYSFVGTVVRSHDGLVCHYFQRWETVYGGKEWRLVT